MKKPDFSFKPRDEMARAPANDDIIGAIERDASIGLDEDTIRARIGASFVDSIPRDEFRNALLRGYGRTQEELHRSMMEIVRDPGAPKRDVVLLALSSQWFGWKDDNKAPLPIQSHHIVETSHESYPTPENKTE